MGPPDQVGAVTPLVVPEIVTLTAVASGHDHVRVWSSRWLSWLAVSDAVDRLLSATAISGALPMFRRLHDALASLSARRPDLA